MKLAALVLVITGMVHARDKCEPHRLAVYHLELDTHWSRELFPKQYPEVRPPAQWSRLVGRSHDANYTLFREGEVASGGMQMFAETGRRDALDNSSRGQGRGGVYDEFVAPAIANGTGKTEARFFADSEHSRLSAAVRIVPSPDWFVGLDSVDLCVDGFWIDSLSVEVSPLDAGTDDGFTFTAPNWPSEPRVAITRITSKHPHHPANSFFYPDIDQLPVIATFHLIKKLNYKLTSHEDRRKTSTPTPTPRPGNRTSLEEISNELAPRLTHPQGGARRRKGHKNRHTRQGTRHAEMCAVSGWTEWTPCSVSCGVGGQTRTRHVTMHGSTTCPSLTDTRWCGEHTKCPQNFFNW